jgi:hypothetical protein
LSKLAEFLVAEGWSMGLPTRVGPGPQGRGVSFQTIETVKHSNDPDYEAKKNRVLELYDIAEGRMEPGPDDPVVVLP